MKYCTKCGKELFDEAVFCPNCGCAAPNPPTASPYRAADDHVSVGLCVLAAMIPLFGIIYWPLMHKETPKKAQACGITAIVSWAVCACLGFLIGFFGAILL